MRQQQKIALQVGNAIFLLFTIAFNSLASGSLREGVNVGDVSDTYATLFAPANLTFSIWGVIYLGLLAFAIYQARGLFSRHRDVEMPWLRDISIWFMLSCIFNVLWLYTWLYEWIGLSLLLMLGLLGSLTILYLRLHIGLRDADRGEKYLVHLPFSIYLAWVNVATVANVAALLVAEDWSPPFLNVEMWTAAVVIVVGMLGVFVTGQRNDIAFGAVFIWALLGIFIKHQQMGAAGAYSIKLAAWVGIGMITLTAVLNVWQQRRRTVNLGYL